MNNSQWGLHPIVSWNRSPETSWTFFLSSELPAPELCSAVVGLCIYKWQLALTHNQRGLDFTGGHIEEWETLEDALFRECYEEWWVTVKEYHVCGRRKITSTIPKEKSTWWYYPFPISYIPLYYCPIEQEPHLHSWEEITGVSFIQLKELQTTNLPLEGIRIITACLTELWLL